MLEGLSLFVDEKSLILKLLESRSKASEIFSQKLVSESVVPLKRILEKILFQNNLFPKI